MATTETVPSATPSSPGKSTVVIGELDIVFNCPNCQGELVVDREGAGLSVPCSHCGYNLTIPEYQATPTANGRRSAEADLPPPARHFDFSDRSSERLEQRFNELKNQLKENRSQDTEMRGHINRATMELHRLQLKLKKLQERQDDIDAEISALAEWLDNRAA